MICALVQSASHEKDLNVRHSEYFEMRTKIFEISVPTSRYKLFLSCLTKILSIYQRIKLNLMSLDLITLDSFESIEIREKSYTFKSIKTGQC